MSRTLSIFHTPLPGEILSPFFPQPFRSALVSMYDGEPQLGSDGERHSLDGTAVGPEQGTWLYDLCRKAKPKKTLEIGLAYGFSTVYFLAAIRENGAGHHTAVDPFQNGRWHGIGGRQPQNLGMSDSFCLIEEKSVAALVHFANRAEKFEMIFIDGNHRFDDALVDFTLSAELCPMGGYIILDDMWMPSIRRAVSFIRSNRKDFEELKTPTRNVAAFRRVGEDTRAWNHYANFFFDSAASRLVMLNAIRRLTPAFVRRAAKAIVRS